MAIRVIKKHSHAAPKNHETWNLTLKSCMQEFSQIDDPNLVRFPQKTRSPQFTVISKRCRKRARNRAIKTHPILKMNTDLFIDRLSVAEIAMRARLQLLLFALLLVALVVDVSAQQRRRKHRRRTTTTTEASVQDEVMNMLEADEIAEEAAEDAEVTPDDGRNEVGSKRQSLLRMDPCMDKHCGAGRVCKAIDDDTAECVCVDVCDPEVDPRRKVCNNYNETFGSDCEVYQARCFCDTGDTRCRGPDYQHVHIEYYGECRQMPMCKEEDMADFPRRMRDWLFNIMRDLADRQELPSHYLKMQREAETNHTLRWTNAAIWKWCDLDGHPHDRAVSRHELFPIRAPLMALEHCIAPFLDSCDINDDHKITLTEWGKCLELEEDDLDDKCDELAEVTNSDQ